MVQDNLSIMKKVEIINRKKFAAAALEPEKEVFVVYVTTSEVQEVDAHLIKKAEIAFFLTEKGPAKVPNNYANYADMFLLEPTAKILKHNKMNNVPINNLLNPDY